MDSEVFKSTTQALLRSEIICATTRPAEYRFLEDAEQRREVEQYLIRIDRGVGVSRDGVAFYCSYLDINDNDTKSAIRSQFKELVFDLEPLLRWLRFAQEAGSLNKPIEAGDLVKLSDHLSTAERSPDKRHELMELTKSKLFKSTAQTDSARIEQIMKVLVEQGYLTKTGEAATGLYRATGKWSYLYDVLEFVKQHERIEDEADTEEQAEMF